MNLINPFQFRDLFASARSFAVVGNAPSILEFDNGALIDSHDVVVRFNRATTTGHERRIGGRTDMLIVNAGNSLAKAPPPAETVKPKCVVCFKSPGGCKELDVQPFAEWVGVIPLLFSFGPDMLGLPAAHRTQPLTSGTYALYTLLQLFDVQRLFVTGFTMFGATAGGARKYYEDHRPGLGTFHDLDQESRLFAALIEQYGGEATLTPEVESLVRENGTGKGRWQSKAGAGWRPRGKLMHRIAEGLAWRAFHVGMKLRRYSETPRP